MTTENEPPDAGPYDVTSERPAETASERRAETASERPAETETGARERRRRARASRRREEPAEQEAVGEPAGQRRSDNMLPQRPRRPLVLERLLVRLIATGGVIAVGVAIAAIMVSSHSKGWIVGLVVSIVSVVLSAILWSSRQL